MKVILNGCEVDFDVCVNLMDDEIREELSANMAPCNEQAFLDAFIEAHAAKFDGEEFCI